MTELEKKIGELNDSVDELMLLVDEGIINANLLNEMSGNWKKITGIPYEYAFFLVSNDLEGLVRRVASDYMQSIANQDYALTYQIHKSNKWFSQVIGAREYSILSEVLEKNEKERENGGTCELIEGTLSYKEIIERYENSSRDINEYIISAEQYKNENRYDEMINEIAAGFEIDSCNYELMFSMGEYYLQSNIDKAFLCFENALYLCTDEDDSEYIKGICTEIEGRSNVRKVAIIIVSYNLKYMMEQNILAIRNTMPKDSYSIFVVDNASSDGVYEWLCEQSDVTVIRNDENKGFGYACNQGVRLAEEAGCGDYDIFLLNNDTRLTPNALFWLRMGLYEDDGIGATGSVSNYAGNNQQIELNLLTPGDYIEYGRKSNIYMDEPYEERVRLSGFAMLIRNEAWKQTGGMDILFSPGYFEDDDLCMRLREHNYKMLMCKNSFIYHAGSQSFSNVTGVNDLLKNNYLKFIRKYGFEIIDYAYHNPCLLDVIGNDSSASFSVLFYGSGLGADLANMSACYQNALVLGIEQDEHLRKYSIQNNKVYENYDCIKFNHELKKIDYLFYDDSRYGVDDVLKNIGKNISFDTLICPSSMTKQNIDFISFMPGFKEIKLVIWDLDETFWEGTLSEGQTRVIENNISLVRRLIDCGVINSISSKNDYAQAMERLTDFGVQDLFVFNDINWEGKGPQIKEKIASMKLRPCNVLFIDDNTLNLSEAEYYSEGIMTATPEILPKLQMYFDKMLPSDVQHDRLVNYRVLEEKYKREKTFGSRDEFLKFSNIEVEINTDCVDNIDRISEMILRTNQINYTKKRVGKEIVESILTSSDYSCGYITARDRFGDYGIVGFYALINEENKLEHFLFSCRVLGMGIEQYIYNQLGSPQIDIVGEVAIKLQLDAEVPWINMDVSEAITKANSGIASEIGMSSLLLKGPCDMATVESYIAGVSVDCEFNYVNDNKVITAGQNHTVHIIESLELNEGEIQRILLDAPMLCRGDFSTEMFEKDYDYICLSLLPDCHSGLYRNKVSGRYISFGSKNYDITDEKHWMDLCLGKIVNHSYPFNRKCLEEFAQNWEYIGCTPIEMLIENIAKIYERLSEKTTLVLVLGSEIESMERNGEFGNHAPWHKEVNQAISKMIEGIDRIKLINPTEYIKSQNDFVGGTNHYSRNVYYEMANDIMEIMNQKGDD